MRIGFKVKCLAYYSRGRPEITSFFWAFRVRGLGVQGSGFRALRV